MIDKSVQHGKYKFLSVIPVDASLAFSFSLFREKALFIGLAQKCAKGSSNFFKRQKIQTLKVLSLKIELKSSDIEHLILDNIFTHLLIFKRVVRLNTRMIEHGKNTKISR